MRSVVPPTQESLPFLRVQSHLLARYNNSFNIECRSLVLIKILSYGVVLQHLLVYK